MAILQSCPAIGEEVFSGQVGSAHIDNLISITPLKYNYTQGEEVTYKLIIPAENGYFGNSVNIYQKTGVIDAWLIANYALFEGNSLVYVKGNKRDGAENWFNLTYNQVNEVYELEMKVKLNKKGSYSFITAERIDFLGTSTCNRYFIYTNIQGKNAEQRINFVVQ